MTILLLWRGDKRTELLVFQRPPARQADVALRLPATGSGTASTRGARGTRATNVRRSLHVGSDRWPKWACRRAPTETRGALLERWRAQRGTSRTTIQQSASSHIAAKTAGPAGYTERLTAFLSPAATSASSPHQSSPSGGPMKDVASIASRSSAHVVPVTCPACQSSAIVTKTNNPDADSYWRCTTCGEIWNASRSETDRHGAPRWR